MQTAAEADKSPADEHPARLTSRPLIIIEPGKSQIAARIKDLWTHRELLYFLTWRDVKVKYKQTLLGAAWAILQPVLMMVVFSLFFGRLGIFDSNSIPYPLFVLTGLVPWTFFASAVTTSSNSMVGSAHLITKIYFPRLLVPAGAVAASLVDLIVAFIPLIAMMLYYQVNLSWHILMLPPVVLLTTLFALAIGTWMSALNVKYRDVRFALPFVIQVWIFVSSVIVPPGVIPLRWRWILLLNPMSAIIESYRSALLGLPFHWPALGLAAAVTLVALLYSVFSFHRVEKTFADII